MTSKIEKILKVALVALIVLGFGAAPAFAADSASGTAPVMQENVPTDLKPIVAIGAGIVTLGGAIGIGGLAKAAMEGTARQPEAGGQIRTSMIIAAALIEGFTFFALVVCILI